MKKIKVQGKNNYNYNVYIKNKSFEQIHGLLENYSYKNVIAFVDLNVDISKYSAVNKNIDFVKISVSEKQKDMGLLLKIIEVLYSKNVNKSNTLILAIGGGVLIDSVGLACSIYSRGLKVGYIPTTLLAMVDASIGSKNGIHYKGKKNLIGTFYDPRFVLIDPTFLKTLPIRQLQSGIAEIVKISYLMNPNIIQLLENVYDYNFNWENMIYICADLKNKIVQKDYLDKHVRKYLNFGHTFGHAIESYYNFEKYTHGEAVAIGMVLEYPSIDLIKDLQKLNLPVVLEEDINSKQLYQIMKYDKKNTKDNQIEYVTLKEKCVPTMDVLSDGYEVLARMEKVKTLVDDIFNQ